MGAPREYGDAMGALAAYEASPAIMLACAGPDLVVASANAAARAMFPGRSPVGRPALEVAPELEHQHALDAAARVLATGRAESAPAWRVRQWTDGVAQEAFFDLTVSPWLGDRGAVKGVLVHGREVTEELLEELEGEGSTALEDLDRVVSLQDAMLPGALPVLPTLELAGAYLLGREASTAGGDWFDVVEMRDGRVALVAGDVVGHGVAAVAVMGQLRAVARQRLGRAGTLEQAMRDVDGFAHAAPGGRAATMCVAAIDLRSGEVEYCTAGHPPPLVVPREGGQPRFLSGTGAGPLGTSGAMTTAAARLAEGELLLLYTDGLMQRPGRSLSRSTVELGETVATALEQAHRADGQQHCPVGTVCDAALSMVSQETGYSDDIALLAAGLCEPRAPLRLVLAADDAALPAVRREVGQWLRRLRARELDHIVVGHCLEELVANVVEHAYGLGARSARVEVEVELLRSGDLQLCVRDWGSWRPAAPEAFDSTRGLAIVEEMVDWLQVAPGESGGSGTVVSVRHRLGRHVHILTGVDTGARKPEESSAPPYALRSVGPGRWRVHGPVAGDDVHDLRTVLRTSTGGRVVLDLTEATLLPSAAVQVLHAAASDARERGQELVLFAPPGCAAQHVLEVVRLPYALHDPDASS